MKRMCGGQWLRQNDSSLDCREERVMTSLYDCYVLPWLLAHACATKPMMNLRAQVVPNAQGRVLELGIGSGINLRFYDPRKVESVFGVDPFAKLRARAETAPRRAAAIRRRQLR